LIEAHRPVRHVTIAGMRDMVDFERFDAIIIGTGTTLRDAVISHPTRSESLNSLFMTLG
jgi:hypothetical protein